MNVWSRTTGLIALGMLSAGGCSSAGSDSGAGFEGAIPAGANGNTGSPSEGASSGSSSAGGGGFSESSDAAALPPEMKSESTFRAPVATGNVVWSTNPTSGRVAYIDATTFNVQTTPAGDAPTYIAAVNDKLAPADDVAIVLNVLSENATLLRVHDQQLAPAHTFASTADANSWAISPSGHWAIAWTDATLVSNPDPTQSFQHIAVMDLTLQDAVPSTILAVGYRPVQVAFSADDSLAFAVTEQGISVIDLTGSEPAITRQDPLSAQPPTPDAGPVPVDAGPDAGDAAARDAQGGAVAIDGAAPDAQTDAEATGDDDSDASASASVAPDVSFTPDGKYALVRQDGIAAITVDYLTDGTLTTVPLPSAPTDLTISPTGTFAVAALRDISTVAILPIPGVMTSPGSIQTIPIPGEVVGRAIVTNDGKSVLLFTTAAPVMRLTVLTLSSATFRTVTLYAPIQAVFPTNDGANAIVLHDVTPTAGSTIEGAFSVVPIAQSLPALIQAVPAPPTAVALSPMSDRAIVSVRDDTSSTYGLYMTLMPSQQVLQYSLASPPIAVGIAAGAGRGYVAQDYSEGRITFVDLSEQASTDAGAFAARTITGFELNANIVVGGSGQ
jgi:hypothetical protein